MNCVAEVVFIRKLVQRNHEQLMRKKETEEQSILRLIAAVMICKTLSYRYCAVDINIINMPQCCKNNLRLK